MPVYDNLQDYIDEYQRVSERRDAAQKDMTQAEQLVEKAEQLRDSYGEQGDIQGWLKAEDRVLTHQGELAEAEKAFDKADKALDKLEEDNEELHEEFEDASEPIAKRRDKDTEGKEDGSERGQDNAKDSGGVMRDLGSSPSAKGAAVGLKMLAALEGVQGGMEEARDVGQQGQGTQIERTQDGKAVPELPGAGKPDSHKQHHEDAEQKLDNSEGLNHQAEEEGKEKGKDGEKGKRKDGDRDKAKDGGKEESKEGESQGESKGESKAESKNGMPAPAERSAASLAGAEGPPSEQQSVSPPAEKSAKELASASPKSSSDDRNRDPNRDPNRDR